MNDESTSNLPRTTRPSRRERARDSRRKAEYARNTSVDVSKLIAPRKKDAQKEETRQREALRKYVPTAVSEQDVLFAHKFLTAKVDLAALSMQQWVKACAIEKWIFSLTRMPWLQIVIAVPYYESLATMVNSFPFSNPLVDPKMETALEKGTRGASLAEINATLLTPHCIRPMREAFLLEPTADTALVRMVRNRRLIHHLLETLDGMALDLTSGKAKPETASDIFNQYERLMVQYCPYFSDSVATGRSLAKSSKYEDEVTYWHAHMHDAVCPICKVLLQTARERAPNVLAMMMAVGVEQRKKVERERSKIKVGMDASAFDKTPEIPFRTTVDTADDNHRRGFALSETEPTLMFSVDDVDFQDEVELDIQNVATPTSPMSPMSTEADEMV